MSESVRTAIEASLDRIESEEDVVILLAVESGSRAWGFPSLDSDYDVRFLYLRRPEWYLAIDLEERRDVIERPITDELDFSGWDLRKALKLFRKSNPPLLEWLQCGIVYRERSSLAARLRDLLPVFYSPRAAFHHYHHMAQGNHREYLKGAEVKRKKYFYVLRPLLAMEWIDRDLGPVPIEFDKLVGAAVTDPAVRQAIDELVAAKRLGQEMDRGPRIDVLSDFIDRELPRLELSASSQPAPAPPVNTLNEVFRSLLVEVWGSGVNKPSAFNVESKHDDR